MFSRHVTKDISAYCHGELSSEESKQFAEHIISCAGCRTRFEEVKLGIKFAELLPQLSAPDHLWRDLQPLLAKETSVASAPGFWTWRVQIAAAAAVLVIASVGGVWLYNNRSPLNGKSSWQEKR